MIWCLRAIEEGIGAVALDLEDDGGLGTLCEGLAACAEHGRRAGCVEGCQTGLQELDVVAVLTAGALSLGDQRIFDALIWVAAGAVWALTMSTSRWRSLEDAGGFFWSPRAGHPPQEEVS